MNDTIKLRKAAPANDLDILENGSSSALSPTSNNSDDPNIKYKKNNKLYVVPILVFIWYSVAIFSITTSKLVMNIEKLPFLLCTGQFTLATIITYIWLYLRKPTHSHIPSYPHNIFQMYTTTNSNSSTMNNNKYLSFQPSMVGLIYPIAISYTLGFIFTNIAFSLGIMRCLLYYTYCAYI